MKFYAGTEKSLLDIRPPRLEQLIKLSRSFYTEQSHCNKSPTYQACHAVIFYN